MANIGDLIAEAVLNGLNNDVQKLNKNYSLINDLINIANKLDEKKCEAVKHIDAVLIKLQKMGIKDCDCGCKKDLNNKDMVSTLCNVADKLDKFGLQDIASDIDKALSIIAK